MQEPYQASSPRGADGVGYADGRWFYGPDSLGVPVEQLAATPSQRATSMRALFDRQFELFATAVSTPVERDALMLELDQVQDALQRFATVTGEPHPPKSEAQRLRFNEYQRNYRRGAPAGQR